MTEFILNHLPWFWLGVCVLGIVLEVFTAALTTIWFSCGAFVLIFLSAIDFPFKWQLLIFAVISFALLIFTRPIAVKKLHVKKEATNSDRLIGRKCLVTQKITEFEKGAVKIDGVEWTAKADSGEIAKGSQCEILSIEGATLTVKPLQGEE
ncbi:MAG: NfeD family protein [Treponema sp.]|nr:NfeD family protein [Candidatus Treponema equifaecale]